MNKPPRKRPFALRALNFRRLHLAILALMVLIMAAELVVLVMQGRWMHVFLLLGVIAAMMAPVVAKTQFGAGIPAEIQIFAMLFVFATIFLGEVHDFYERFWWWDLALHATSGILLGLLGFLVVYLMNESEKVDLYMRPSFVALFAFAFAVMLGALWEVFEFAMDELAGLTMQKPMLGDPSGLTDTMWDLIVDIIGAGTMSLASLAYMRRARHERTDHWLRRYVRRHQTFFDGDDEEAELQ